MFFLTCSAGGESGRPVADPRRVRGTARYRRLAERAAQQAGRRQGVACALPALVEAVGEVQEP